MNQVKIYPLEEKENQLSQEISLLNQHQSQVYKIIQEIDLDQEKAQSSLIDTKDEEFKNIFSSLKYFISAGFLGLLYTLLPINRIRYPDYSMTLLKRIFLSGGTISSLLGIIFDFVAILNAYNLYSSFFRFSALKSNSKKLEHLREGINQLIAKNPSLRNNLSATYLSLIDYHLSSREEKEEEKLEYQQKAQASRLVSLREEACFFLEKRLSKRSKNSTKCTLI